MTHIEIPSLGGCIHAAGLGLFQGVLDFKTEQHGPMQHISKTSLLLHYYLHFCLQILPKIWITMLSLNNEVCEIVS